MSRAVKCTINMQVTMQLKGHICNRVRNKIKYHGDRLFSFVFTLTISQAKSTKNPYFLLFIVHI